MRFSIAKIWIKMGTKLPSDHWPLRSAQEIVGQKQATSLIHRNLALLSDEYGSSTFQYTKIAKEAPCDHSNRSWAIAHDYTKE